MDSEIVKVASIQCSSLMGDKEFNKSKIIPLVKEAAEKGAKIIVLPETSLSGYLNQDLNTNWYVDGFPESIYPFKKDPINVAESCPGPLTSLFCDLAKELKIYLTIPFLEIDNKNNFYNTVCLADPNGNLVAHYRKNYTWPVPEKSWATNGTDLAIYESEYGKIGLAICYDIHSILGRYAKENIWTLLYSIAWVGDTDYWFNCLLPNKLKLCNVPFYIVGSNWSVDQDKKWKGYGRSTIYEPLGKILEKNPNLLGDSIIYANINVEKKLKKENFNYKLYEKWDFL